MKFTVFLILMAPISVFTQIDKKRILKSDSLKYYTVQSEVSKILEDGDMMINRGSGFFIKYKKHVFYISNYHLLSGRSPEDTSFFVTPKLTSEYKEMAVSFYSLNKKKYENINISLHDVSDKRTYFNIPADTTTNRLATDIGIIELDTLPGDSTVIYPIELKKSLTKWSIPPNSQLICYGYSKRTWDDLYPYCDTIFTVGDSSFLYNNQYISVYNPPNMHGSSGSPVFYKYNGKFEFVGVLFGVVPLNMMERVSYYFPRTYYSNPIGLIITTNYLKDCLDAFLKSGNK